MTTVVAGEVRERFCPRCGTVHPVSEADCPHCGLELAWLEEGRGDFAEALRLREDDPCEIDLRAVWGDGSFATRVPDEIRIDLLAGPAGPVSIEPDGAGACRAEFESGRDAVCWPLPGRVERGGVVFSARRCVAPTAAARPRPLEPHDREFVLGRPVFVLGRTACDAGVPALPSVAIEPRHAVVAWRRDGTGGRAACWIAALRRADGRPADVFVNGHAVRSGPLESGDLLQVGPFGWVVNLEDGLLVPAGPVDGAAVRLESVRVGHHLGPVDLEFAPGSLVAVVGPSGAGKSTLVRAIVDGRSVGRTGRILVSDGEAEAPAATTWRDVDEHADRFRAWLGFVPQESILHPELTVRDSLRRSARLRGRRPEPHELRRVLQQVDLPESRWDAPCRELSGGEDKRVRTAAELLHAPRLLLLDEPASGLDPRRERSLLRLLRTLASRGGTVLVVTHNWTDLEAFDRVVEIRGGKIAYDGPPSAFGEDRSAGEILPIRTVLPVADSRRSLPEEVPVLTDACGSPDTSPPPLVSAATAPSALREVSWRDVRERVADRLRADAAQFRVLLGREWRRMSCDPAARLGVPLLVLPLFFAAVLAVGVPVASRSLMGFLAILSSIWMGSSLALGAIVGERRIYDHERILFLRRGPYLAAKLVPLWSLALVQTAAFLALLWPLRTWLLAGTRTDPHLGENILGVAGILGLVSLAAVGQGLLVSALAGSRPALANFLLPLLMMAQIVFSVHVAGDAPDAELHEAYERLAVSAVPDGGSPRERLAGLGSHLTISRPADVALRSFAYHRVHPEVKDGHAYGQRRCRALSVLWFQALVLPAGAGAILALQERLAAWRARSVVPSPVRRDGAS